MEWKKPEVKSYTEEELLKSLEVKAQYHTDGFNDAHLDTVS